MLLAALALTRSAAYVLLGGLLWRMVLSLSQAYSPLVAVLNRVYEPLCRPFAFLRIGRWDFSGSLLAFYGFDLSCSASGICEDGG